MSGTFWTVIPAVVTILLGLITKKVNLSLIVGIIVGVLMYSDFIPLVSIETLFKIMIEGIGSRLGVVIFVIMLGMFIHLMNKSGATRKYGEWAKRRLKTKRSSLLFTYLLGILIFVDDYFNCLTVGTVMRPVTDRNNISRAKLAYIIDTTAAPICMIAPISSWAAAVSSSLPESSNIDGFSLFLKTIPANYYSLLSIVMVIMMIILNFDYGTMKKHDNMNNIVIEDVEEKTEANGKVYDLILPVVFLIISCVFAMLYTGGIFDGANIIDAFKDCDAILSLCIGGFLTLIFIMLLYIPRKIVLFDDFFESISEGFKNMVPSIIILCLAWTLSDLCGESYLNIGSFVKGVINEYDIQLEFLPVIFFIFAIGLSFSTGTSWGSFAILIPMAVLILGDSNEQILVMSTAAVLSGCVCGDHLSPISDTTILSSTGADCNHLVHVQTQAPYGLTVASVSVLGYLIAGATNYLVGLGVSIVMLIVFLIIMKFYSFKNVVR